MKKEATTPRPGSCTTLDHVYPKSKFGTRCYCGARVWGSKKPATGLVSPEAFLAGNGDEGNGAEAQKTVDTATEYAVDLSQSGGTQETISLGAEKHMAITLKLKGLSKSGKYALYSGLRTVARLSVTDFPDSKPVDAFTVEGDFAGPRVPKEKLTKEQRAELRKNAPKPTLAEKAAKLEAKLAKLREQVAAEANA